MCRRKATIEKIPVTPGLLKEPKLHFQRQIKQMEESKPDDLIINFDQTPLSYVCSPNHTVHFKGGKSVPLVGKGKSKHITGTFSCTKSGIVLPMQLIYQGQTKRCHLTGIEFPEGFNITHVKIHWSNEDKVIKHLESIIICLPSQREPSWVSKKSKNACSFLMFLWLNALNVFLIWLKSTKSTKTTSQKCSRNINWADFFGCPYCTICIKTHLGLSVLITW